MDIFHSIPSFFEEVVKFLVFGVGLGYLGKKMVAEFLIKEGRELITKTERNSAIWQHYQRQASGDGHMAASVLDCGQDKCKVFGV